jgi:hypothetical protein
MLRVALIIRIVYTFYGLTVNADRPTRVTQGTDISIVTSLGKAFTACPVACVRMTACHHDISFAATILLIIGTIFHSTF